MSDAHNLGAVFARMIEATGPISVAQFMAEANHHYYNNRDPLGADGDFITAPEVSQMFGELIGLWCADLIMRAETSAQPVLVEMGPGRGTLSRDALLAMAPFGMAPELHLVETSEALRVKQAALLPEAKWHDSIEDLPSDRPLIVIANEFFDALPVRQLVATHAGWRERVVTRDKNGFMAIPGTRPMDAAVPEQFRNASPGAILETSPAGSGIAYELAARIGKQGGAMLIVDYGYDEPQLGSTLQAVSQHEKAEVFAAPGEQDLTAHVNFAEIRQAGLSQQLVVQPLAQQGAWLKALGIEARAAILLRDNPERVEDIDSALERLTSADQMGSLFKVMAMTHREWPRPEGFVS